MDSLTLLTVAREAGLTVRVDGDKLIVRGPRAAEALALQVLEHKAEVVRAMAGITPISPSADPVRSNHEVVEGVIERARDEDRLLHGGDQEDPPVPVRPVRRPPPPADPGGYCAVHKRLLTYREQVDGGCSWCSGAVRLDRPARSAAPRTCLECLGPLPPDFKYFCVGCVAKRAEHADVELPL
jgi:hypothetical protein